MRPRSVLALCAFVLIFVAPAGGASPRPPSTIRLVPLEGPPAHPALAPKATLAEPWRKVSHLLRESVAALAVGDVSETSARVDMLRRKGLQARDDGRVRVAVHVSSLTGAQAQALRAAGVEVTFESARYRLVEGWLALGQLEGVAALDFVTTVQPAFPPLTSTGSVTSQGDAILRAAEARQLFGISGQGVKVGVLSDSVDGIDAAMASGDLPSDVQVLQFGQGEGEGTAMLEIVHDLAPGSPLAFYGPSSSGDMISGINQLAAAGAKVIVDDLTFFDQPNFEEGPVAQAVNELAAQGIVYVTSAGNFAQQVNSDRGHYEADFVDGGALGSLQSVHRFTASSVAQSIVLFPNSLTQVFLQWSDPFGQAADDYDLYVVDSAGNVIAASEDVQNGNGVPLEAVVIGTAGSAVQLFVIVNRFSGAAQRLELYYSRITDIDPGTPAGSIAGHANASGAITVATVNAGDPGNDDVAPYSSQGPCDLFFPVREVRAKPDITGIDGVVVTGAAGFPSPFFGTSAAAPHIAAVAALMRQYDPTLTPAQVKQDLEQSAVDLGASGFDFISGAGRADAVRAVAASGAPPQITTLSADLNGDAVALDATAVDADGDIAAWKGTLYDGAGTSLGDTGNIGLDVRGQTSLHLALSVTGLGNFPTATQIGLLFQDLAGHQSPEVRADFSQPSPGGPVISSASYRRSSKKLRILGSGLVPRGTQLEANGVTLAKRAKVNRSGSKAVVKGAPARLGLRSGPNRIRVIVGTLHSNIAILIR